MTQRPINHGTLGGYKAHYRRSEPPCEPCREAGNAYDLSLKRARQAERERRLKDSAAVAERERWRNALAESCIPKTYQRLVMCLAVHEPNADLCEGCAVPASGATPVNK